MLNSTWYRNVHHSQAEKTLSCSIYSKQVNNTLSHIKLSDFIHTFTIILVHGKIFKPIQNEKKRKKWVFIYFWKLISNKMDFGHLFK